MCCSLCSFVVHFPQAGPRETLGQSSDAGPSDPTSAAQVKDENAERETTQAKKVAIAKQQNKKQVNGQQRIRKGKIKNKSK